MIDDELKPIRHYYLGDPETVSGYPAVPTTQDEAYRDNTMPGHSQPF